MPPPPLRIVLLRTQTAENLGACARALKNCGLSDWVWVNPEVDELGPARRMAVHAEDVLDGARRASSLEEAVADCVWVVGTSSRTVRGKRRLPPRAVAEEAWRRASDGPVALVFGDERSGLRADELERCHDLSAIPADGAQPSLNLAQAVLLYAYELRLQALAATPHTPAPTARAADDALLARLQGSLESLLRSGGFLRHEGRHAVQDLFAPLRRARLSLREAELWNAALRAVEKRLPGAQATAPLGQED